MNELALNYEFDDLVFIDGEYEYPNSEDFDTVSEIQGSD